MISEIDQRFWEPKIRWHEAGDVCGGSPVVRIQRDGERHHYIANPYAWQDKPLMGCSGGLWVFRLPAGSALISNDVWHQGAIPPELYDRLPVNAEEVSCTCGRWGTPRDLTPQLGARLTEPPCWRCEAIRQFVAGGCPF
jgi:hypothetical protein